MCIFILKNHHRSSGYIKFNYTYHKYVLVDYITYDIP